MTLREMIAELAELPPEYLDRVVVMSKDGEGNSYSPYYGFATGLYGADSTWSGEVRNEYETEEEAEENDDSFVVAGEQYVPCIVLQPIN